MSQGDEEQIKAAAHWYNNLSVVVIVGGLIAPLLAPESQSTATTVALALACFIAGIGLHLRGRHILGRLK